MDYRPDNAESRLKNMLRNENKQMREGCSSNDDFARKNTTAEGNGPNAALRYSAERRPRMHHAPRA